MRRAGRVMRPKANAGPGRHHSAAMAVATDSSVLANFKNTNAAAGVLGSFFKRDGKFFVRTDGPDGARAISRSHTRSASIRCSSTWSRSPKGRLQALTIGVGQRAGSDRWSALVQPLP